VFFENEDCTGAVYFHYGTTAKPLPYVLAKGGGEFFVLEPNASFFGALITTRSWFSSGTDPCSNDENAIPAYPARRFSLAELGLTFPLPAPLYIAPSPGD
jgi:hypothetical protein